MEVLPCVVVPSWVRPEWHCGHSSYVSAAFVASCWREGRALGFVMGAFMSGRLGCVGAVAAVVCGMESVAAAVYHWEPVCSGLSCRDVGLQGLAV